MAIGEVGLILTGCVVYWEGCDLFGSLFLCMENREIIEKLNSIANLPLAIEIVGENEYCVGYLCNRNLKLLEKIERMKRGSAKERKIAEVLKGGYKNGYVVLNSAGMRSMPDSFRRNCGKFDDWLCDNEIFVYGGITWDKKRMPHVDPRDTVSFAHTFGFDVDHLNSANHMATKEPCVEEVNKMMRGVEMLCRDE